MNEQISIAPDIKGTIASVRVKGLDWIQILGELIDNSFDADATRVEIALDKRELTVDDDGVGCNDIERMLTLGKHSRHGTTKLGRYGVGLKEAAWWLGGPTRIETRHGDQLLRIHLDWDRMSSWFVPRPEIEQNDGKRGTRIRFESISQDRRIPDGERLKQLLSDLAFTYSPAIRAGRQIVFRRSRQPALVLQRHELPQLTDIVDTTIEVDGKQARVHVGIVPAGVDNPRPGIIYTHAFRVIHHSALGCGGLGSSRIAGWVSLDRGWALSRNKDDIAAYRDELGDAVFAAIRPIVEKASTQAMTLKSASLSAALTTMFRAVLGSAEANAKAQRDGARNKTGSVQPTGDGAKHKRARKTQRGSRFRDIKAGEFRIDFKPCGDALGEVDLVGSEVWLNDLHPLIQDAKRDDDRRSLIVMACHLLVSRDIDSATPLLTICRDGGEARKVEVALGKLLAELHAAGVMSLKAVA